MPASKLLKGILRDLPTETSLYVHTANTFAEKHISNIKRRSGESYAEHGREVASTLRELSDDGSLLAIAILHDLLVRKDGQELLRASPLKPQERRLVLRMHELRRLHIDAKKGDLDRMIDAFAGDRRLILLRMAHRLNDVRHLDRFQEALQHTIAHESLHMYAAIAGRLGMNAWRSDMENICFRALHPDITRKLEKEFESRRSLDELALTQTKEFLQRKLRASNISCTIEMRIKDVYSTYRKMVMKRRAFHELTDRLALRLIVKNVDDCYRTLGIVHQHFHAIPGKIKDYISLPKENGYQSLHTVVFPLPGVTEQPMEIQIRTQAMHDRCRSGIAAHGEYKTALHLLTSGTARVDLARNLLHLRQQTVSAKQFEEALRTYFGDDHVAIFDTKNNLYHLRSPATALDFICHTYGKKCHQLRAVRINGREQPMHVLLRNGDTVEPLFGYSKTAHASWLRSCKHAASKKILRAMFT